MLYISVAQRCFLLCVVFFALASNISYLIILMCLIVCLKVFHPLSTGAGARAYIFNTNTHSWKVIVRFTSFFSELERLSLTMPRRKLYIFFRSLLCRTEMLLQILMAPTQTHVETDLSSTIMDPNHLWLCGCCLGSTGGVKCLTPDFKSCSFIYGIASDNCFVMRRIVSHLFVCFVLFCIISVERDLTTIATTSTAAAAANATVEVRLQPNLHSILFI